MRQVAEEDERRHLRAFEHSYVFDFDEFAFVAWRRICGDVVLQHGVELRCGHRALAVGIDGHGFLEHLVDALLGHSGGKDDGEVGKGRESLADGGLVVLDGGCRLVLDEIPLVHYHHDAFLVALYERVDVDVLGLDTSCGVEHEYAHVAGLDGAYGADHGVVLYVLVHFVLLTYAGGIDEVEVESEFAVARVDGVARGAGDIGHDVPLGADKSIDYR